MSSPQISDHPRSRGVYLDGPAVVQWGKGSSPLARGLPYTGDLLPALAGIIPARAGFTVSSLPRSMMRADHPRSRGVYAEGLSCELLPEGSSPLARGLLDPHLFRRQVIGIIPARAGFTRPGHPSALAEPDHPRSRGVYLSRMTGLCPVLGSSPLARGLHCISDEDGDAARIIPARAGFTLLPGLLVGVRRIIPARAGFTDHGRSPGRAEKDHPRSRGVYRRRQ